jgi:type II secretory pathway pseudopilin PulG
MKRQGGYTIIEVSLFLAISAALLLLVAGLQSMVTRQRFQDSMTSLRTTIQSEYEEVRSGINSRLGGVNIQGCGTGTSAPGADNECLMIGKLIRFNADSSNIYINYVVAAEATVPQADSGLSDQDALSRNETTLKVIDPTGTGTGDAVAKRQTVGIQRGSEFVGGWTIPDDDFVPPENINGLAILRSPVSGAVLVFAIKNGAVQSDGRLRLDSANAVYNIPTALMIRSSSGGFPGAAVCIDRGQTSSAVRLTIPVDNPNPSGGFSTTKLKEICVL